MLRLYFLKELSQLEHAVALPTARIPTSSSASSSMLSYQAVSAAAIAVRAKLHFSPVTVGGADDCEYRSAAFPLGSLNNALTASQA